MLYHVQYYICYDLKDPVFCKQSYSLGLLIVHCGSYPALYEWIGTLRWIEDHHRSVMRWSNILLGHQMHHCCYFHLTKGFLAFQSDSSILSNGPCFAFLPSCILALLCPALLRGITNWAKSWGGLIWASLDQSRMSRTWNHVIIQPLLTPFWLDLLDVNIGHDILPSSTSTLAMLAC